MIYLNSVTIYDIIKINSPKVQCDMDGNKTKNVGFYSIHLEAAQDIVIKKGMYIKCNESFSVNDGVLYIDSKIGGITIALPQANFDMVELESEYGSVKCDGVHCKQLTISSSQGVKVENSCLGECEISSEYSSIRIIKSKIGNANLSASQYVNVELDDFSYVEIESEYAGVKFIYNDSQLINVDCNSEYGTVKAQGAFYGDENCDKKVVATAAHDIKLLSRNK